MKFKQIFMLKNGYKYTKNINSYLIHFTTLKKCMKHACRTEMLIANYTCITIYYRV